MFEFMLIAFSGGGGPSTPKVAEVQKQDEPRRIVETAGEAKKTERKRVPPGRTATMFSGISKELEKRLG